MGPGGSRGRGPPVTGTGPARQPIFAGPAIATRSHFHAAGTTATRARDAAWLAAAKRLWSRTDFVRNKCMILKCLLYFLEMRDQFYAAAQQKFVWRRFFALSYFAAMQYAHSRWTNPVTAADIAADLTTKGPEFDHE
jgi:hypothetical protein